MARVLKGEWLKALPTAPVASSPPVSPPIVRVPPAAPAEPAAPFPQATPEQPSLPPEDLDAVRRQARSEGFEAGRRDAQQQIESALAHQEATLRQTVDAMTAGLQERLHGMEEFAVAVAYEACARVLTDAAIDERGITSTVCRLLEHARETGLLRVQLPPAYVESLRHTLAADPHWQHRAIEIEADPTLRAGECRVVSAHGQLESSLAVQLDAVRESLLATFAERAA